MIPPPGRRALALGAFVLGSLVAACGSAAPTTSPAMPGAAAPVSSGPSVPDATNGVGRSTGTPAPRLLVATLAVRLPVGLVRAAAFPVAGGIVVAGGATMAGTTTDVLRVAFATGTVARVGTLASPVHDAAAAVAGGELLVIGGGRTVAERVVQTAGTVAGTGATRLIGSLPHPRADASAVTIGDTAYVVGGWTGTASDPVVLATTDGRHFRSIATLPVGVRYPAVAAVGGLIYVIGGDAPSGPTDVIQVVDPAAGTARIAGRLSHPLSGATALVLAGRLIVAGGRRDGVPVADVIEIDPATLRSTLLGRLPGPRAESAGVTVDGVGYLVGGEDGSPLASIVSLVYR